MAPEPEDEIKDEKNPRPLDEDDIALLKTYFVVGLGDKVSPTDIEEGMRVGPDTLDPALLRPGRLDRKVEFGLPDLESRTQIFKIHTRTMNCERDIRFELLARLCPNSTGADIRSVCTEAGMYAIRARRKTVTEKDFLDAVNKVIKGYQKFSATPKYMVYN
ncbi:UNVERIFIED_CONTAM: 26S proteasome regulatory subunitA [Sesamum latifolium]|uniref:26S proteasome regulatory subunitA n=1 Tax=Sesamum latifolium TaxID=2727402 RepID=A0AAW2YDB9_9LAMI